MFFIVVRTFIHEKFHVKGNDSPPNHTRSLKAFLFVLSFAAKEESESRMRPPSPKLPISVVRILKKLSWICKIGEHFYQPQTYPLFKKIKQNYRHNVMTYPRDCPFPTVFPLDSNKFQNWFTIFLNSLTLAVNFPPENLNTAASTFLSCILVPRTSSVNRRSETLVKGDENVPSYGALGQITSRSLAL